MISYLKILGIGIAVMVILVIGIVGIGYIWAKSTGKLATHQKRQEHEEMSYEAFAGGFDTTDNTAPVNHLDSDENPFVEDEKEDDLEDDFTFEFDSADEADNNDFD